MTATDHVTTVEAAAAAVRDTGGEPRAGGTDVMTRATRPAVDLLGVPGLGGVEWRPDGSARIGALTTISGLLTDTRLTAAYPALAATAAAVATPQIRNVATVGGNLLQRNRCWYLRNPAFACHQTGGDTCHAREGAHLYSAVVDQGPCVAPHPSSLAVALLTYGATAEVHGRSTLAVADLYGDGADPTRDHRLEPGEILQAVLMPPPMPDERAAYRRATSRQMAEWPLVETAARLTFDGDTIATASVAVGGVARTPLLLPEVAEALLGKPATEETLTAAADLATARCTPLPQNAYKVTLLRATLIDTLTACTTAGR
ncbi:xanthine dehydrogenase YagS FAD-binding subunit [Actinomadura meyerae]|uniref:Xanthine dehydrogenase YagS FAD-binding subunit n=1 Tax=Actinomadura meyerae TaxID=240840 RepID=A0A239N886_9ACTN|nr:FAD binding domain-containing protein [Actinomadura meyerae]SNT51197.1 xanthine dehydrogenase YagS FAD-binding subunit [Actinomadura meyerae]